MIVKVNVAEELLPRLREGLYVNTIKLVELDDGTFDAVVNAVVIDEAVA
jgi:hypothetical protein